MPRKKKSDDAGELGQMSLAIMPVLDKQVAEIERYFVDSPDSETPIASSLQSALGPIINSSPTLAAALKPSGKYVVEFSAAGNKALRSGNAVLLQRAEGVFQPTLVTRAGRFLENGKIVPGAAMGVAAVTQAAHLAVLVVVQVQLVQMEASLRRIEEKIDAIQIHLKNEKLAECQGRVKFLKQMWDEMANTKWTAHNRQQWQSALDDADAEFLQIEEFAVRGCTAAEEAMRCAPMSVGWFGAQGTKLLQRMASKINEFRYHYDLRLMCLGGRVAVAHLRRGLGGRVPAAQIDRDIEQARQMSEAHERLLHDRALEFSTLFRGAKFDSQKRRKLRKDAQAFHEFSEQQLRVIREQATRLDPNAVLVTRLLVEVNSPGKLHRVRIIRLSAKTTRPPLQGTKAENEKTETTGTLFHGR